MFNIECQYLDYKSVADPMALAKASEEIEENPHILKTCHRLEFYGVHDDIRPELFKSPEVITLESLPNVVERLISIAVGVESEILGEWAIEQQVSKFVQGLSPNDKIRILGEVALAIARSLRAEFEFYGPDHAGLALSEIRKQTKSQMLLVFGAGMIGKKLAEIYESLGYSDMFLVTRNRRKAKKRIKELDSSKIVTLDTLNNSNIDLDGCDILIASSDIHNDYGQKMRRFIEHNLDKAIIDVSARPLIKESEGITLNTQRMIELVDNYNIKNVKKTDNLKARIHTLAEKLALDLNEKWQY